MTELYLQGYGEYVSSPLALFIDLEKDSLSATTWVDNNGERWWVGTVWTEVDGRDEVVGLMVRHSKDTARYDSTVHRNLPVGAIIADTRKRVIQDADQFIDMWRREGRDDYADAVDARRERMKRVRTRYTEDEIRLAAEIYRKAFDAGAPPTRTVQTVMKLPKRRNASTLVRHARDRGFLPETEQRKAKA